MLRQGNPVIRTTVLLTVLLMAAPSVDAAKAIDILSEDATAMQHHGVMKQKGDLGLFRIAAEDGYGAPLLELSAASGWGHYLERTYLRSANGTLGPVEANLPEQTPLDPSESIASEANPLNSITLQSKGSSPSFDVRISRNGEGGTIHSMVRGVSNYSSLPQAQFLSTSEGLVERDPNSVDQDSASTGDTRTFLRRSITEPTVLTETIGGVVDARILGDFILEILGPTVNLDSDDTAPNSYDTGLTHTELVGGVTQGRESHLRLIVTDGDLRIRLSGINHIVQWVSEDVEVNGDNGRISYDGVDGSHESELLFTEGYSGTLVPDDSHRLGMDFSSSSNEGFGQSSSWYKPAGFVAWPIVTLLVLGAAIAFIIRSRRDVAPPLEYMEQALEAGAFTRAARLATRILREDPKRESAHLGRAIALSRTGQPERVVRNLESYLNGNDPSDGTLHYVLGLAYRDMGKNNRAQSALAEAVKRTPALADQVPGYVAPAPSMAQALESDAHGYT